MDQSFKGALKMDDACLFCGEELIAADDCVERSCMYCQNKFMPMSVCKAGHYVCNTCCQAQALITDYCISRAEAGSINKNPINMAMELMRHSTIQMHGAEHHYLIPAVLLTAYHHAIADGSKKFMLLPKLREAQMRARNVFRGFCAFYGACGAAVGTGIFISVITGATPLSTKEWSLANLMTADVLREIANNGGPRCCKRNTFLAITAAADFVREHFGVNFEREDAIICEFFKFNKDCKYQQCLYFPKK